MKSLKMATLPSNQKVSVCFFAKLYYFVCNRFSFFFFFLVSFSSV